MHLNYYHARLVVVAAKVLDLDAPDRPAFTLEERPDELCDRLRVVEAALVTGDRHLPGETVCRNPWHLRVRGEKAGILSDSHELRVASLVGRTDAFGASV